MVVLTRASGSVVEGADEVRGEGGGIDDPVPVGAEGSGAAPPGCSEATTTLSHAVAPPAPSTTARVRKRMRACARSRASAATGRRVRCTNGGCRGAGTREFDGLMGSARMVRSQPEG